MLGVLKKVGRERLRSLGYVRSVARGRDLYRGYDPESIARKRFYNIGAGTFSHPFWTNIDHGSEYYSAHLKNAFVEFDLMARKPLPLASGSAELVYSSHTIEHVDDGAVRNVLAECHRILKPGGVIRLQTPDARLGYRAYLRKDRSFWYWAKNYSAPGTWEHLFRVPLSEASIPQLFLLHYASQICEVDADETASRKYSDAEIAEVFDAQPLESGLDFFCHQCTYNPRRAGNHINWWTHEKLTGFLEEAGFEDVYRSGWGQSVAPPLRDVSLFDGAHASISLYVEAVKG